VVSQIRLRNWVWSQPVLANGVLYVADLSGFVYALNPENLAIIWETQVSPRGIRPSPLVTENYIIVASRDGKVHWLGPNGTKVMERQVEGGPEILSELVYVPANLEAGINEPLILVATVDMGRLVVAFSEQTGVQRWSYAR
jgi:outer membrane protein assembly factor BamB